MHKDSFEITLCIIVSLLLVLLIPAGCVSNGLHSSDKSASSKDLSDSIKPLINEGTTYFRAGDFDKAQEVFENALKNARLVKDDLGIGTSMYFLGSVYLYGYRDYPKALEYLSQSLGCFNKINNLEGKAFALAGIFDVYKWTGDDEKALETIETWLPLSEKLLNIVSELKKSEIINARAFAYWYKAHLLRKGEKFSEALQNYRLATSE